MLDERERAKKIFSTLLALDEEPKSELYFHDPFTLIVSVMLSAQCLDSRVNKVTPALFEKYPNFEALANADVSDVENIIKSVNFYKNKSKNIINMSKDVINKFNGQLPDNIEELVTLPGVGRKTAQVVLVEGLNRPEVPVDTHIFRVINKTFGKNFKNVLETENFIRENFESNTFVNLHKLLVLHGRYICKASKPTCENCPLKDICVFNETKE